MFKCYFCRKVTPPRTPCKKIILLSEAHRHPMRPKALKKWVVKNGREKIDWANDPGGSGTQIVQEASSCPLCAAKWEREQKERAGIITADQVVLVPKLPSAITPEPPPPLKRPPRLRR